MPDPNSYNNKDDFLKACIPIVIKEGKDNAQAVAICNSMWEKKEMKLETVNIGNVEIFETGTWKGQTYTEKDIDTMVDNFNNGVAEPFITIDHSSKATSQFKDALQSLSLGFIERLERKGRKLVAWFKQVPKTIADLIDAGALKKKSIEFYRQLPVNGKLYNNVLQGVTFHGANGLPEVNTLSDFLNLYKSNLQVMEKSNEGIVSLQNSDYKEDDKMSDELIKMKDQEIVNLKNQLTKMEAEKEEAEKDVKEKEEEIKEKDAEIKEKDEALQETEKEKEENLKTEAVEYVEAKINDKLIRPAHKDRYVKEYIEYKKDDKLFKDFKDDIENRDKVIDFNPTVYPDNGTTEFKYEPEKLNYKAGSTINYSELQDKVDAVMKAEKIDFQAACIKCGITNPNEFSLNQQEV